MKEGVEALHAFLEQEKIPHRFCVGSGSHDWPFWQGQLRDFAPRLFREGR